MSQPRRGDIFQGAHSVQVPPQQPPQSGTQHAPPPTFHGLPIRTHSNHHRIQSIQYQHPFGTPTPTHHAHPQSQLQPQQMGFNPMARSAGIATGRPYVNTFGSNLNMNQFNVVQPSTMNTMRMSHGNAMNTMNSMNTMNTMNSMNSMNTITSTQQFYRPQSVQSVQSVPSLPLQYQQRQTVSPVQAVQPMQSMQSLPQQLQQQIPTQTLTRYSSPSGPPPQMHPSALNQVTQQPQPNTNPNPGPHHQPQQQQQRFQFPPPSTQRSQTQSQVPPQQLAHPLVVPPAATDMMQKVRLVIPRKRKLSEVQSNDNVNVNGNANGSNSNHAIGSHPIHPLSHQSHSRSNIQTGSHPSTPVPIPMHCNQPPLKKQRLSPGRMSSPLPLPPRDGVTAVGDVTAVHRMNNLNINSNPIDKGNGSVPGSVPGPNVGVSTQSTVSTHLGNEAESEKTLMRIPKYGEPSREDQHPQLQSHQVVNVPMTGHVNQGSKSPDHLHEAVHVEHDKCTSSDRVASEAKADDRNTVNVANSVNPVTPSTTVTAQTMPPTTTTATKAVDGVLPTTTETANTTTTMTTTQDGEDADTEMTDLDPNMPPMEEDPESSPSPLPPAPISNDDGTADTNGNGMAVTNSITSKSDGPQPTATTVTPATAGSAGTASTILNSEKSTKSIIPIKPLPIKQEKAAVSTTTTTTTTDGSDEKDEKTESERISTLPPPPPLQAMSPPPPTITPITDSLPSTPSINPYLHLHSQLQTNYAWPSHAPDGRKYTHICSECGQGFLSGSALGGHKGQHTKARRRAQQMQIKNQYYYPKHKVYRSPKASNSNANGGGGGGGDVTNAMDHNNNNNNNNNGNTVNGTNGGGDIDVNMNMMNSNINNGSPPRFYMYDGVRVPIKTHNLRGTRSSSRRRSKNLDANGHYRCETCGETFASGSALGGHRSIHGKHGRNDANQRANGVFGGSPRRSPRRNDDHNRPDANGKWPTHDVDGNPYTRWCDVCGKGFLNGSALGGHRSVHTRMERLGRPWIQKQQLMKEQKAQNTASSSSSSTSSLSSSSMKTNGVDSKAGIVGGVDSRDYNSRVWPDGDSNTNSNSNLTSNTPGSLPLPPSITINTGNIPITTNATIKMEGNASGIGFGNGIGTASGSGSGTAIKMEMDGHHGQSLDGSKSDKEALYDTVGKVRRFKKPNRNYLQNNRSTSPQRAPISRQERQQYQGLSTKEIMTKIMDKLCAKDKEHFFLELDESENYKKRISDPISFVLIRSKIENGKYSELQQDFMADLNRLFRNVFKVYPPTDVRCKRALELKQFAYRQTMAAKTPSPPSAGGKAGDLKKGVKLSYIRRKGYDPIEDYEFFCDDQVLKEKMRCKKKVKCDGKWCSRYDELGPYCLQEQRWQSQCECRAKQMECTDECACDPTECKNRAVSRREHKKLGSQVREQECFGMDQHTHMSIAKALPRQMKQCWNHQHAHSPQSHFIEKVLCPAINNYHHFVKEHPEFKSKYDPSIQHKPNEAEASFMLTDVLRTILFEAEQSPQSEEKQTICRIVSFMLRLVLNMGHDFIQNNMSGIERSKRRMKWKDDEVFPVSTFLEMYKSNNFEVSGEDVICHEEFPIYSKGKGVICTDKQGIRCNEYVISFLGVVYSPWTWFEKEDRTRWLVRSRGAEKHPDFFNISLERHRDDPDGYDVMFVDPTHKGNYGSRLSHSCDPNCLSVSMGVDGKYRIAVYAQRDIEYGEELCFDYNSVTESEQEWQEAVCLCSTRGCNGQFLLYQGTQLYTEVLRKEHTLLHRTGMLFNAMMRDPTVLKEEEKAILDRYCLKDSVLSGIPIWMQKYAASICGYIDYEQEELPKVLVSKARMRQKGYEQFLRANAAEDESKGLRSVRLSNLVITLNKMNLFFRNKHNQTTQGPMFGVFEPKEVISKLWLNTDSLISDLVKGVGIHVDPQHAIIRRVNEIRSNQAVNLPFTEQGVEWSKKYLLELREMLLVVPPTADAYHHAASDILLFYASTTYLFQTLPQYQGFHSREFSYHELGYDASGCPQPKKYSHQYVWGQLNFWERHTIESPDSSLSAERRGCVQMPNVNCCYVEGKKSGIKRKYDYKARKAVIKHLWHDGSRWKAWSSRWHFGFRNGGFFGSPWLDAYIDPARERPKLMAMLETMRETKMIYPDGTWTVMESEVSELETSSGAETGGNGSSSSSDHEVAIDGESQSRSSATATARRGRNNLNWNRNKNKATLKRRVSNSATTNSSSSTSGAGSSSEEGGGRGEDQDGNSDDDEDPNSKPKRRSSRLRRSGPRKSYRDPKENDPFYVF